MAPRLRNYGATVQGKEVGNPLRIALELLPIRVLHGGIPTSQAPDPVYCESGDEDVLPVVVEVGEMAGGGGVAEVEIPVEVQEGAVIGVQGGGED